MATGPATLLDILATPGIADIVLADRPSWLWATGEGRILFANAAGVAFFREDRLSALVQRRFDMSRPGLAPLARAETALPRDGNPRLVMLRLVAGLREVAMPCLCRLVVRGPLPGLVLAVATGGAPDARTPEERARMLFDDAELAVELLRDSESIYRSAAAQAGPGAANGTEFDLDQHGEKLRLVVGCADAKAAETQPGAVTMHEADASDIAGPPTAPGRTDAGEEPKRFSFVLDADGRFVEVGPALEARVGARFADIVGRHWADVAQDLALDPQGALAAALRRREPWGGIVLEWPSEEGTTATVHLSAQPRFADGQVFAGYRGFGDVVCITASSQDAPAEKAADDNARAENGAPEDGADRSSQPPDRPPPAAHLRTVEGISEPIGERLNQEERSAFEKIAAALGASLPDSAAKPPEGERSARARAGAEDEETQHGHGDAPADPAADASTAIVSSILDRLPLGIAVLRDDRILYANDAFLSLFGYSDLDDLEIAGGLAALFDGQRGANGGTITARRQDGAQVLVESRLGRLDWAGGAALFVTAREAGAPVGAGQETEIAELRAMLDTATDGVLVLTTEGRIEAVNRSAEALLGRDAAEIKGGSIEVLLAEASRGAVREYLARLAGGGVESLINDGCEVVALARGGEVPLFVTMGRIGDGEPARFCAVMRDLTQWKAAEAELVAARKRAEEASAQKSDFLAKISHEIRTPLNAIIGFAEVMLEGRFGPVGNERYQEYLKDVRASGEHIMSLVNDLLDLSKVEAGRLELSFSQVNLNDIVEQSVAIMQPQANGEQVIVRTSLARGLPPVMADARSMRQVMLNLLSNAIKFTPPGGQAFVSTGVTEAGDVMVRVRDTGIGMSEADIQTAMEPFRQLAVRPDTRQRGTGLGLPLTRALVEANRAGFAIRSRINEGTLVEIAFPRSRVLVG